MSHHQYKYQEPHGVLLSAGNNHSLATKTDGTLWAWGYNSNGQLGQNNTTRYSSPVQIPGTSWSSISGGGYSFISNQIPSKLNNYKTS
jgi:alpha-tubulin suppressor-like RCC1 family protein